MKDRLPLISIKIDTSPSEFLDRMQQVALQSGQYLVDLQQEVGGEGTGTLILKPMLVTQHRDLEGSLSATPGSKTHLEVEVHAARWHPDPPTYQVYATAARELFMPLLHSYNLQYRSNRKLNIQSREATEPRLPEVARILFEDFERRAYKSSLHEGDWHRFYRFIRHCSAYNIRLNRDDIHRLLVFTGFSMERAAEIADVYEHGRALLKMRGSN
jgi:hypothetical protein